MYTCDLLPFFSIIPSLPPPILHPSHKIFRLSYPQTTSYCFFPVFPKNQTSDRQPRDPDRTEERARTQDILAQDEGQTCLFSFFFFYLPTQSKQGELKRGQVVFYSGFVQWRGGEPIRRTGPSEVSQKKTFVTIERREREWDLPWSVVLDGFCCAGLISLSYSTTDGVESPQRRCARWHHATWWHGS